MPKWNQDIDGNHLRIASHQGSTMRVLAGPGTGKSYALKRKVMRLLEEGKDPSRILALTFTNVAADSLKKELNSLEVPGADLVRARTLHSLSFEILRKRQVFEITGRNPRPLMEFETDFLLEDLQDEFGGKKKTKELLQAYESAFARQQHDEPGVLQSPEDLRFKTRLLAWLTFHQAMLIGELIPITHDYLRIMSLHKSKGLTSKVVFILGCVAGLVPTIKDEKELIETNQVAELDRLKAEAKRLFFVALTRTTKYLFLSSFREIDFGRAMQLNVKFTSRKGIRVAYTQSSPFFGEVARHLPHLIAGEELLKIFGTA